MPHPEAGFSHARTDAFIRAASSDPNLPIERVAKNFPHNALLVGTYFATPGSLADLARARVMSRANAHDIIRRTIVAIHKQCTPETQKRYSLGRIPTDKPMTRERKIWRLMQNDDYRMVLSCLPRCNTFDELKKATNLDATTIDSMRRTLARLDIRIPLKYGRKRWAELTKQVMDATAQQLRELVPDLPAKFVKNRSGGRQKLFATLTEVAQGYRGVRRHGKLFAQTLRGAGIPMHVTVFRVTRGIKAGTVLNYYHFPVSMLDEAHLALDKDPRLLPFRKLSGFDNARDV